MSHELARRSGLGWLHPGTIVAVAKIEESARLHAMAEGHEDPYPNPLQTDWGYVR